MRHRLIAAIALLAAGPAAAQGLVSERNVSATMALDAVQAAVAQCAQQGYRVTAVVVDRSGQIRALLRGDGAGPHTFDSARRKAYTAATLNTDTMGLAERIRANPVVQPLTQIDNILAFGGGLPIRVGTELVGAIGVGGAPGVNFDEACAQAGIERIRDRLQ